MSTENKWCRIIEMQNGEQTLITKTYDEDEQEAPHALAVQCSCNGIRATLTMGFKKEEDMHAAFDNFSEDRAMDVYNSIREMSGE